MSSDLALDVAVRRELLRLGMLNLARSVPLQLIAVVIVGVMGFLVDAKVAAISAIGIGVAVGGWRRSIAIRFLGSEQLNEDQIAKSVIEVEANSALAGILWAICATGIYPPSSGTYATAFHRHSDRIGCRGCVVHAFGRPGLSMSGADQLRLSRRRQSGSHDGSIITGRDLGRHSGSHDDSRRARGDEHDHSGDPSWS